MTYRHADRCQLLASWIRSSSYLGASQSRLQNNTLGAKQKLRDAVNDRLAI